MTDESQSSPGCGCVLIALLIALNLWASFVVAPAMKEMTAKCRPLHARVAFVFDSLPGLVCVRTAP